jgi:cell division protein FtsN
VKKNSLIVTLFFITAILIILGGIYLATLPPEDVSINDIEQAPPHLQSQNNTYSAGTGTMEKEVTSDSAEYFIIVGSFRNPEQAGLKARELNKMGSDTVILLPATSEGNIRISFGTYKTMEEARTNLEKIRADIASGAWILTVLK